MSHALISFWLWLQCTLLPPLQQNKISINFSWLIIISNRRPNIIGFKITSQASSSFKNLFQILIDHLKAEGGSVKEYVADLKQPLMQTWDFLVSHSWMFLSQTLKLKVTESLLFGLLSCGIMWQRRRTGKLKPNIVFFFVSSKNSVGLLEIFFLM